MRVSKKEVKEFCKQWGQTDSEAGSNLDYDEEDGGFSELMMDDYVWVESLGVWVPENNSFYTDRDNEIVEYIKENR